jgi:hypothetical protein
MIKNNKINFNNKKRVIAGTAAAAAAIVLVVSIATSGAINGGVEEAQAQTGTSSNVITIIGTTDGERILIDEDNANSEICTFEGVVVRGSGVTSLGKTSLCPNFIFAPYGWNISPNPSGKNTIYNVLGNGVSGGGLNVDSVEVDDGGAKDNDVYSLDANQFHMFDGPGDDVYRLLGDLSDTGESASYSDSTGNDKVSFAEQ